MSLTITPVANLADLARFHTVLARSFDADHEDLPADCVEELAVDLAGLHADEDILMWVGEAAGRAVAAGRLSLPVKDNTSTARLDVHVHPDDRRSGHGLAMARHCLALAAAQQRQTVLSEVCSPLAAAEGAPSAFARRLGLRPVLEEVRRVLDLTALDGGFVDQARRTAAAVAHDYEVVQWVDAAPDALCDDLARLAQLMSTDPPKGEMTWEPERWDAARWRATEERVKAKQCVRLGSTVVHRPTGRAVGYSDIGVSRQLPEIAYQWATIVESAHRGHRLGMLLKAANLQLLRRELPVARTLNTWNAAVNSQMISINETLGFRPVERWTEWQLDGSAG